MRVSRPSAHTAVRMAAALFHAPAAPARRRYKPEERAADTGARQKTQLPVFKIGDYPEGTKRATSVNVQLLRLQKDLRTGSISRDIVNFPSKLCRHRSDMFTEVARLVPPDASLIALLGVT